MIVYIASGPSSEAEWQAVLGSYLEQLAEASPDYLGKWYLLGNSKEEALSNPVTTMSQIMDPTEHIWTVGAWNGHEGSKAVSFTGRVGSNAPEMRNALKFWGKGVADIEHKVMNRLKEKGLWIEP